MVREPLASELREFAQRDWERLAQVKQEAWIERKERLGPASVFQDAAELFAWAQKVRPDWPSALDRQLDLEHHARMNQLFDRVAGSR